MGYEVTAWNAFISQLTGDTDLDTYVSNRFYPAQSKILNSNAYPFVVYDLLNMDAEEFIAVPKLKAVYLNAEIHGKVKGTSKIADCLEIDELIKDAIEKDLSLSGNATIELIDGTEFKNLDNDIRECRITVKIYTKKFTAGDRS